MKILVISVAFSLVVAGCSPAVSTGGETTDGASGLSSTAIVIKATDTPASQSAGSSSSSQPLAVTVRPPAILLGPSQTPPIPGSTPLPLSPSGWLTFTSLILKVKVDYPADWAVTIGADGATFTSPSGQKILLQSGESPTSQNCTTLTNVSGQTAKVCSDSTSGLYSATFGMSSAGGSSPAVTLSTTDQASLDVYKAMINSVRPAQ
jgi:hypothetical protein